MCVCNVYVSVLIYSLVVLPILSGGQCIRTTSSDGDLLLTWSRLTHRQEDT